MSDESLRRADDLLTELIETVETARAVPMSTSCVLPRERVLDLLDELREVLPPEMDEARTLVATRERVLKDSYEAAAEIRQRAVTESDAVQADTAHRVGVVLGDAEERAASTVQAGNDEHARLVANTTVHQAAAAAAAALRQDAERYQAQISADAQSYDTKVRTDADDYVRTARAEAQRYATKLTADAENYAERTLDELSSVLNKAAATAEQGRAALAQRGAGSWAAAGDAREQQAEASAEDVRPPISA